MNSGLAVLSLDVETTTHNKGNVYDSRNEIVCWSAASDFADAWLWNQEEHERVQEEIDNVDLIVGFNFKFDLAWLRQYGVDFSKVKIWDVQIAEFIISCQRTRFPSLNNTCLRYSIPTKLDIVKTEYWDKGIDTRDVPWPTLREYAAHDAAVTLQCYYAQLKLMSPPQIRLCQLMCQDMVVLQEMENNGLTYNEELCSIKSEEIEKTIETITKQLSGIYPHVPLNFNSGDDLSAFLYGGRVEETRKVHDGFYKTGKKAGQPKLKNETVDHHLPRLFEPIKGSALKKEGYFETNEGVLRKLKGKHKHLVEQLLQLSKLEKLNGTYYKGLPKLNAEMHWPKGKLHGQLNQTLAQTGRLSSSRPNTQNFASELQDIFISDFE